MTRWAAWVALVFVAAALAWGMSGGSTEPLPQPTLTMTGAAPEAGTVEGSASGARAPIDTTAWIDVVVTGRPEWLGAGSLEACPSTGRASPVWTGASVRTARYATATGNTATGRIAVDGACAVWLRVRPDATGAPTPLRRVMPFRGSQTMQVALSEAASLHVFVLDALGREPAAEAEVIVEQGTYGGFVELRRTRTDVLGHTIIGDIPPGQVRLRTAASNADDSNPCARIVPVAERGPLAQQVVTLLMPPIRTRVELDILVQRLPPVGELPPRAFLREPSTGRIVPILARLREGHNMVSVEAEPGDYDVDVVPVGHLRAMVADGSVRVREGEARSPASVVLAMNHERTMLHLEGIATGEGPARVTLRDPEVPCAHAQDLLVLGALTWHLPALSVPVLGSRGQVVAFTRRRAHVSLDTASITAPEVRVRLVPACVVRVRWTTFERPLRPMIVVRNAGPVLSVPLWLRVEESRVVWTAEVALPEGPVRMECFDGEGSGLWHREVVLAGVQASVDV